MPQTVPEEEIQQAKAATGTMETIAEFTGPALATALVLGLGAGWAFTLDALTFLVSAFFLLRVHPRERGAVPERQAMRADLREGWAAVRARVWLWSILLCFSAAVLLSLAPWFTLGPTVAEDAYGSRGVFGVLTAAMGAGTIAGAVIGFTLAPAAPDARRHGARAAVAAGDARLRDRAAAGDRHRRRSPSPASAWRCSGSGGRPRWPSACRRTCSHA